MKKIVLITIALLALGCYSCKKSSSNQDLSGSWTLNSITYQGQYASFVRGALFNYTGTNSTTGSLALTFFDGRANATPVTDTTVHVTSTPMLSSYILTNVYPPDSGYVYMQLTDSSLYNAYYITGSTTPNVSVTKQSNGKYTVVIPPVMVVNKNTTPPTAGGQLYVGKPTGTDSSLVSGTIIQTN